MTDLVEDLDVNRTVLSAFINQTYGMNFNRYLNRFRLRELDRLRLRPANQGKSVSSLIGQVGFKDFRTYSRAVATEREAAAEVERRALAAGYRPMQRTGVTYKAGDKVFYNNGGKAMLLATLGKRPLDEGVRLMVAHIDSPRLDLKPKPL